jgi:hypothetical protein
LFFVNSSNEIIGDYSKSLVISEQQMNQASSRAAGLEPPYRQQIALKVLTRPEPISTLAEKEGVSRKFLYKQGDIAQDALRIAFEKPKENEDVLFYLPVTKKWLSQLILALILLCHYSLLLVETRYSFAFWPILSRTPGINGFYHLGTRS